MTQLQFSFMADGFVGRGVLAEVDWFTYSPNVPSMRRITSAMYDIDGADKAAEDERDGRKTD